MSNHSAKKRYFEDIESNFDYIPLDSSDPGRPQGPPSDPRVRPARAPERGPGTKVPDRNHREEADAVFSQNLDELCSVNKMIFSSFQKIEMLENVIAMLTRENGDLKMTKKDLERDIAMLTRENGDLKMTNKDLEDDLASEKRYRAAHHSYADKKVNGFRNHIRILKLQLKNIRDGNAEPIREKFYPCRVCQGPIYDEFYVCCNIRCGEQLKCAETDCIQQPDRGDRRGTKGWFTRYCYEHAKTHSEIFDEKVTFEMMPDERWKML